MKTEPPDASEVTEFYKVPYALCAQQFPDREFLLISYGSNGLGQMSQRLGVLHENMKSHSYAAHLKNYARGFFGRSPNWNQGGIATVVPEEGAEVLVIAHKITHDPATKKFKIGDEVANFPFLYNKEGVEHGFYKFLKLSSLPDFRSDFSLLDGKDQKNADLPVWIFVGNLMWDNGGQKRNPSPEYIHAIQKMLMDRRELLGRDRNEFVIASDLPQIDVRLVGPDDIEKQL